MLREYRLKAGLTIKHLAKLSGVSATGISQAERITDQQPKLSTVKKICEALQIPTYYITGADKLPGSTLAERFEKARLLKCHSLNQACRTAGIDIHTYYRCRDGFGLSQETLRKIKNYIDIHHSPCNNK